MVTVVVAHAHPIIRRGICIVLSNVPDCKVVGETGDGDSALELCRRLEPDVLLLGAAITHLSGLEILGAIQREHLSTKVLILTAEPAEQLVSQVMQAGATGCIVIGEDYEEQIVAAVEAAAQGDSWLSPGLLQHLLCTHMHGAASSNLTRRELQVLGLIARGMGNTQIAELLGISKYTVQNHVAAIYNKLGTQDRSQTILYALRNSLVNPNSRPQAS